MAFKQPRVPEYQESEGVVRYLKTLTQFLKDFCQEAWTASRRTDKLLAELKSTTETLLAAHQAEKGV